MGHNVKFHCLNLPELTPSAGYITERNILRASGSFSWNDNTRYGSGLHYIQILLCVSLWHQLNLEATYDISQCHIVMTCYVALYRYTDIQIYRCTEDILGHLTHHFSLSPLGLHTERTENPALHCLLQITRGGTKISRGIYRSLCNVLTTSAIWCSAWCHHNMTLGCISVQSNPLLTLDTS